MYVNTPLTSMIIPPYHVCYSYNQERRLTMKDNNDFKPLYLNETDIFEPIDLSKAAIFEPIDFSNEFEPIDFSKFDFEPEEFDKCVEKLNKELEIALENAEKNLDDL